MMKTKLIYSTALTFLVLISLTLRAQDETMNQWPQWRGPLSTGAAAKGNPPIQFSESQNLKWKTPIPGKGHATPVVWGNKIVVQTAVPAGTKVTDNSELKEDGNSWMEATSTNLKLDYKVILVNLDDGKILWETTVNTEKPQEKTHQLGSWASNSPCTDGEFIYAYFGSRGMYCLDFEGKILWKRDFGQMEKKMSFGEGSSPYLYKDRLFIQWDHEGDSYIFALDKRTGKTVWKDARDEATSWATPLVLEVNGKPQVITAATSKVRSYDYETGDIIWTCTGLTSNVIPDPVYARGILYVMSGYRGNALLAIDIAKAKGDITNSDVIKWQYNQDTPYTPSPVLMNDKLFFLRANNGFLTCLNAINGDVIYSKEKLEGISTLFSSPTGVDNRLYIAAENICLVVSAGDKPEIMASNSLDDNFHASPVIVGNKLILRGFNSLYCFEE